MSDPFAHALSLLENRHLLLSGGAGTGKSHLLREILYHYRKIGRRCAALGSTGVAAVNVGGQTVHSFFQLGLCRDLGELALHDKRNRRLKELYSQLHDLHLIAIDEVSMIGAAVMEMIAYRLKVSGFSGRVVFAGDFYQLPPVEKGGAGQGNLFAARWAFESDAWREMSPALVELTVPHRADDPVFLRFLDALRRGRLEGEGEALLQTYAAQHEVLAQNPTHLYGRNREVDTLNHRRLAELQTPEVRLEAVIKAEKNCSEARLAGFIKALNTPQLLILKARAPVLFTANKRGVFYNGERGEVLELDDELVTVQKEDGETVFVERQEFVLADQGTEKPETLAVFSQFPLRPAWAVTIHKSQGMGLCPLAVNLDNLFESGQLYVALSRTIDPARLFVHTRFDPVAVAKRSLKPNEAVDRFYENASNLTQN